MRLMARPDCPCCGCAKHLRLLDLDYRGDILVRYINQFYGKREPKEMAALQGARYQVNKCDRCGLMFQGEVPDSHFLKVLYGEWVASQELRSRQGLVKQWLRTLKNRLEISAIKGLFQKSERPLRVLDFGMGWGDWCVTASKMGLDAYGTELSEFFLEHARESGVTALSWQEIPDSRFHFINTEQVFEHLVAPRDILERLTQALIPEGILKISVPNGNLIEARLKPENLLAAKGSSQDLNAVAPLEHLNCFGHEVLVNMAQEAGLHLLQTPAIRLLQRLYCMVQKDQSRPSECTYLFFQKNHGSPVSFSP